MLRRWHAPNLVVLTRAVACPVPSLGGDTEPEPSGHEKAGEGDSPAPGNKKEIVGISNQTKLRLARLLSSLDWSRNGECIHVSLTYHLEFPTTKDALAAEKSHLTAQLGSWGCGIWRLEFQERGAPHWHVILWLMGRDREEVVGRIVSWWARHSGNSSEHACTVTPGDGRAAWYLAMHAAKDEQAPKIAVGRWWGYIRRDEVLKSADMHDHGETVERERVWWARLKRRHGRAAQRRKTADRQAFRTLCRGLGVREPKGYVRVTYGQHQGFSWFLPRSWQTTVGTFVLHQTSIDAEERSKRGKGWGLSEEEWRARAAAAAERKKAKKR